MTTERLAYTREEAAELVGVSVTQIKREIHAGRLRAKKVGNRYRIDAGALRDWFDSLPDAEIASEAAS